MHRNPRVVGLRNARTGQFRFTRAQPRDTQQTSKPLASNDGASSPIARCVLHLLVLHQYNTTYKCHFSLLWLTHRGDDIRRQPRHDAFGEHDMFLALLLLLPRCTIAWVGHRTARGQRHPNGRGGSSEGGEERGARRGIQGQKEESRKSYCHNFTRKHTAANVTSERPCEGGKIA